MEVKLNANMFMFSLAYFFWHIWATADCHILPEQDKLNLTWSDR